MDEAAPKNNMFVFIFTNDNFVNTHIIFAIIGTCSNLKGSN